MNNGTVRPIEERFWAKVVKGGPDDCWNWTGYRFKHPDREGLWHGQINRGRRGTPILVHRLAWELAHGPIPTGLRVLHRCDNPACVNVNHLFLGTQGDNVRDAATKGRMPGPGLKGERVGTAKLTIEKVRSIRRRAGDGELPRHLAREFGVTRQNIRSIVRGDTWREDGGASCAS